MRDTCSKNCTRDFTSRLIHKFIECVSFFLAQFFLYRFLAANRTQLCSAQVVFLAIVICIIFIISHVCCESFCKNLRQIFNARHMSYLLSFLTKCSVDAVDHWCLRNDDVRQKTAATPFGYCSSTTSLPVWLHCANARRIRCQTDLNSIPSPWRTGEDHRDAPYYVDEDYPAGPGIIEPLPERRN